VLCDCERELYSRKATRGGAMPDRGGLNRKMQCTGNDFTEQRKFQGK
jgi:hypothetical protein